MKSYENCELLDSETLELMLKALTADELKTVHETDNDSYGCKKHKMIHIMDID